MEEVKQCECPGCVEVRNLPASMKHTYRVWFKDGSARLVMAQSPEDARNRANHLAVVNGDRGPAASTRPNPTQLT